MSNPANQPPPQKTQRIQFIDGLRGLAVLIILCFHLNPNLLKGGFVGVDIFFVISGFLITQIIANEIKDKNFSFARFYARRIRRIFPALFVMLSASAIAAIFLLGPSEFRAFFKDFRFASAQASNILFSKTVDYFALRHEASPLLHTWSLGVEEQFYFVWPFLLYFSYKFLGLKKIYVTLTALFFLSLGLSEYLLQTTPLHAFYLLHARAWELALGGIIALRIIPPLTKAQHINLASLSGLILIILAVLLTDQKTFPGIWALLPCLGAGLIIYSAQQKTGIIHHALSNKALVWTGLISYSLYLWHWPLIIFFKMADTGSVEESLTIPQQIGIALASFIFAAASYKWIEQPTSKITIHPKRIIFSGLLIVTVFILSSNVMKRAAESNWRVTYKLDPVETAPNNLFELCASPGSAFNLNDCVIGPNKDKYEVILSGDSHASHYTPAVLKWAQSKGYTVRLIMRGACQAWVRSENPPMRDGTIDTDCMNIRDEFYKTLSAQKSVKYVFLSLKLPKINKDIETSLSDLSQLHKETVFLGSVPIFKQHPHNCMVKNHLLITKLIPRKETAESCLSIDQEFSDRELEPTLSDFVPALGKYRISYFDPLPHMHTAFDQDGHFLYLDVDHLNQYGGLYLGGHLIEFMNKQERKN